MTEQIAYSQSVDQERIRLMDQVRQRSVEADTAQVHNMIRNRLGEIAARGAIGRFVGASEAKALQSQLPQAERAVPWPSPTEHAEAMVRKAEDALESHAQNYNGALYDNAVIEANNDLMQRQNEDGSRSEKRIVTPDVLFEQLNEHMQAQADYLPIPGGQVPVSGAADPHL